MHTIVANSKATDVTTTAVHQNISKTKTTQTSNQVDIVSEQMTSTGIVKLVLGVEDWDIYLANKEHHNKIRTIGNKTWMLIKTRENTIKTVTQIPFSSKLL